MKFSIYSKQLSNIRLWIKISISFDETNFIISVIDHLKKIDYSVYTIW